MLIPVNKPVLAWMVALAVNELLHVPPVGVAPIVDILPTHTSNEPVIEVGLLVTVTTLKVVQPAPDV